MSLSVTDLPTDVMIEMARTALAFGQVERAVYHPAREIGITDQRHGGALAKACWSVCPRLGSPCWTSPYDGARLRDPQGVQIDHRVPLAEAARSGAAGWTRSQRERFFNDPGNYATVYTATKATYGLSVDPAECEALTAMLATCQEGSR
jgi:hypothetical protein